MKNFRYLITVLALVNAGLAAQATAATSSKTTTLSARTLDICGNRLTIGTN